MKRAFFIFAFLAAFAATVFCQGAPPWTIQEIDGSPRVNSPTLIKITNGALSCTGKTCTITVTGGSGSPGGASGTVQWNDGGAFNGTSGLTATATTVTIVSGVTATFSRAGLLYTGTVTTDNASVQTMLVQGDRATVTANDEAYITYRLSDDGGNQTEVARQTWAIPTVTDGAENGRIDWSVITNGVFGKELQLAGADLSPSTSDGLALGTSSLMWSDLFLASGAVVNFNAGNVVLTHSAGILTMGTGELRITTVGTNAASVPTIGSTSTFTNKTIAASSNTLGSVTMDVTGTDADGDIYYRASNVLTRLGIGTAGQCLLTNAGATAPEWGSCGGGGSGITIGTTTITSGTNTRVLFNNSGVVGEYVITGTGNVAMSASPTFTGTVAMAAATASGTIVQTSASATAFESGPNGGTNPVFRLVNNTASSATGLSITGNAAGSSVTLTALSSGTDESITLTPKGTGAVNYSRRGSISAPAIVFGGDTNSGIYSAASGYVGFTGSGTLRFGLDASQRLTVYNSTPLTFDSASASGDVSLVRSGTSTLRVGQHGSSSTAAGNFLIGTSAGAIGTNGAGVLAFTLSTTPTTSPTDTVQLYSGDAAAGAHETYWRNEAGEITRATGLAARNSSAFTATSSTTLTNITGLTRNVEASRVYAFRAVLQTTAPATGGVKLAVSGTATATAISYEGILEDGTSIIAKTRATALDTTVCASTTSTTGTCTIEGVIAVNAAGTLTIQFAQNASDGSASTVLANQYFQLIPIT